MEVRWVMQCSRSSDQVRALANGGNWPNLEVGEAVQNSREVGVSNFRSRLTADARSSLVSMTALKAKPPFVVGATMLLKDCSWPRQCGKRNEPFSGVVASPSRRPAWPTTTRFSRWKN
jgi:hypothetical protein